MSKEYQPRRLESEKEKESSIPKWAKYGAIIAGALFIIGLIVG